MAILAPDDPCCYAIRPSSRPHRARRHGLHCNAARNFAPAECDDSATGEDNDARANMPTRAVDAMRMPAIAVAYAGAATAILTLDARTAACNAPERWPILGPASPLHAIRCAPRQRLRRPARQLPDDSPAPARRPDHATMTTSHPPALDDVLAYTHSDVVFRFAKTYGISREASADIFEQVKKFLWLANHRRLAGFDKGLAIDMPIVVIDEMWHNFVLFTKEYTEFCTRFFGHYLHHAPATEAEEIEHKGHLAQFTGAERANARKDQLRDQYEYIFDHLGKDTFVKWYLEYPKTYSFRQLAEMQLRAVDDKLEAARPRAAA
jgi:hypothetical protein